MAASKEDIKQWLLKGKSDENISHVLIVCDTYDYNDYPVYVTKEENVHEIYDKYSGNMQTVMEVYNFSMDIDKQLNEFRANNF